MTRYTLTREQRVAINRLWRRGRDGATTYREFRRRWTPNVLCGYVAGWWCGQYMGIERDGYTHS